MKPQNLESLSDHIAKYLDTPSKPKLKPKRRHEEFKELKRSRAKRA